MIERALIFFGLLASLFLVWRLWLMLRYWRCVVMNRRMKARYSTAEWRVVKQLKRGLYVKTSRITLGSGLGRHKTVKTLKRLARDGFVKYRHSGWWKLKG